MPHTKRAFVLLSGGLDSTTCLYKAIYDYAPIAEELVDRRIDGLHDGDPDAPHINWVEAISVDYGQRHKKEFEFAAQTCKTLGIKHSVLNLGGVLSGAGVMLTDASVVVPDISYNDIKGVSPTYVPFRNGTLLSIITAHAQKWVNGEISERTEISLQERDFQDEQEARDHWTKEYRDSAGVYFGAHAEDAHNWAYPDCTPEFIGAMANAIYTGSYYAIRLHTPLQWLSKSDVVRLGARLDVPFENTWSCYKGLDLQCGVCPTCRSRRDAFVAEAIYDPTKYAA